MDSDPDQKKLDDLGNRIREASGQKSDTTLDGDGSAQSFRAGQTGYEFIGTVLVCAFVGWLVDRYLGTKPWGVLVMIVAGFVAGTLNVWRALNGYDQSVGLHKKDGT